MSDLGLYLAGAADWPSYERSRDWIRDNDRSGATSWTCSAAPGR